MKTTLYQLNTQGKVKVWNIEVKNQGSYSDIIVTSGQQNGGMVENIAKVTSGKNEGKQNSTTHYTQAISEMNSKIESQLRKGYVRDLKDVKSSTVLGSGLPASMLAQKYHPQGSQKGSKTLTQLGLVGKSIVVQFKLDGNRCSIKIDNGKVTMYSARSGDIMPVQLAHIIEDINKLILEGIVDSNGVIILDGELYSNKFSFNTLNGLIKREKASSEDIEKRKFIKFHLYDVMDDMNGYEIRSEQIKKYQSENIDVVPSYKIIATDENIQKYLKLFLSKGFEGLMIRKLGLGYEHKRSWQLIKVKIFEDSEFKLVGFEEDKRGGFVGSFLMEDANGNTFSAGASGQDEDERTFMWNNQNQYLGKMATIEYFGLSEYNVPRFGKFKGIRE